jgi:hypothetical protein
VGVVIVAGLDETESRTGDARRLCQTGRGHRRKELHVEVQALVRPGAAGGDGHLHADCARQQRHPCRRRRNEPGPGRQGCAASLAGGYGTEQKLVDIFYYQRALGVNTGSLIVINKDGVSQQLAEGGKGGGGGDGYGGPEVREELADAAYWRGDAVSDENGVIEFSVPLPDNLTTWTLLAKAVTADSALSARRRTRSSPPRVCRCARACHAF